MQASDVSKLSPCDVQRLQKCLAENKGDREKCLEEINTFQKACGQVKPTAQQQQQPAAAKQ